MFPLKPFQEDAISRLRKSFLELWKTGNYKIPLVFKSPTGSGKTIMMTQFLKDLTGDPQFDVDKAFLWFTFNQESYEQSKKKLFDFYGGANELDLLDLNDLNRGKLEKNNVFFINWDKIRRKDKESLRLRRDNEQGVSFDNFIKATQEDKRDMVAIIDEEQVGGSLKLELVNEIIEFCGARIVIIISATPKNEKEIKSKAFDKKAGFIEVHRKDVIEAELIKEKIVTQTKEDLEKEKKKELEQEILLLELAFKKRLELKKYYEQLKKDINPLVLIQLPNDDVARNETTVATKEEIVRSYLKDKNVSDDKIATWLSNKKENLEGIEKNNSPIEFLIFKQAAATGWDCPRADVLVMFREIKTPDFHTQTLGRILRMPEAQHYSIPELNVAYLYTNYERNQITENQSKLGDNKPAIYTSYRKDDIKPEILNSIYLSRTDYNDLGDSFQNTFKEVADKFLKINKDDSKSIRESKINKAFNIKDLSIKNNLIVGAEIEDYDNFVKDIQESGEDLSLESSKNDLERMYNLICFNLISQQEDEDRKFAPERSWGKVKTALNVYFSNNTKLIRSDYYKLIVKDLLKEDSKLLRFLGEAFSIYRPIREIEVQKKSSRSATYSKLEIPPKRISYTDDFSVVNVKKSAMEPFYLQKEYVGSINEKRFARYLDSKDNVKWWYKNGDFGSEYFAIRYRNNEERKDKMFYPDWIVRTKTKLLFLETKKGDGVESLDTKYKAEALQKWLKQQKYGYAGGIAVEYNGMWKINNNDKYNADLGSKDWNSLDYMMS
jgi:type III restriction enzyme